MKYVFYTVFIALINNLDNIGVRIAYSIRGIKITTAKNLWISVITFIISTSSAFSGSLMSQFFSKRLSSSFSMALLTTIGLWIIIEPYIKRDGNSIEKPDEARRINFWHVLINPEHADMDNSKDIDFKEATILGIALSINNIGGGLGAGLIGLNSLLVGLFSAVISFFALWMGNYVTAYFVKWKLGKAATLIAGLVLIVIGIEQIL